MKADLANKYDLRVPRYTSYPTAPHFSEAVDEPTYRRWLADLDPKVPLSLYTHIPFCDEMCWFCGCYTKIVKRYEPVADYLATVLAEIDLLVAALPERMTARHLHWGGGSPTMLTGEDWRHIIDHLRQRFRFAENAEIAVEMDPRTATEDYVKALAAAGVNRTSIGVQDFDAKVQEAIHRIQPFEVTERVIGWLRRHGIAALNMDLMYGLPFQTTAKVVDMVDRTIGFRPLRIALFGYAHVPWMKSHQKMIPEETLPGTEERWEQFTAASDRLAEAGYVRIGLDHFALPEDDMAVALDEGRLHRNFQGYTTDAAPVLLGLGASAIGQLPQGYIQNHLPLRDHKGAVEAGRLPIARGVALSGEDILRRAVIEKIMCELAVDLDAVCAAHGTTRAHFATEIERLAPLVEDGIADLAGGLLSVPDAGRPFVRLVAATFDAYLDSGQKRHSKAV